MKKILLLLIIASCSTSIRARSYSLDEVIKFDELLASQKLTVEEMNIVLKYGDKEFRELYREFCVLRLKTKPDVKKAVVEYTCGEGKTTCEEFKKLYGDI